MCFLCSWYVQYLSTPPLPISCVKLYSHLILTCFLKWKYNYNMPYTVERIISLIENNRPILNRNMQDPCGICRKKVKMAHAAIQCDCCDL